MLCVFLRPRQYETACFFLRYEIKLRQSSVVPHIDAGMPEKSIS